MKARHRHRLILIPIFMGIDVYSVSVLRAPSPANHRHLIASLGSVLRCDGDGGGVFAKAEVKAEATISTDRGNAQPKNFRLPGSLFIHFPFTSSYLLYMPCHAMPRHTIQWAATHCIAYMTFI